MINGKGNHSASECFTFKRKSNNLNKINPERFKGKNTGEMMTILNNVVNKISNAGTTTQQSKVEEEIKNVENLTVSRNESANDISEFKQILMNELEDGKIDFANSNLHE